MFYYFFIYPVNKSIINIFQREPTIDSVKCIYIFSEIVEVPEQRNVRHAIVCLVLFVNTLISVQIVRPNNDWWWQMFHCAAHQTVFFTISIFATSPRFLRCTKTNIFPGHCSTVPGPASACHAQLLCRYSGNIGTGISTPLCREAEKRNCLNGWGRFVQWELVPVGECDVSG